MRKILFVIYLLCTSALLFAQQEIVVKGKVSDANDEGIPGVSVIIRGTSQGTVTDFNGEYSIQTTGQATLVFTFIGFVTQEVPVNNNAIVNVSMDESTELVDEVVVIGYGTVKKSDLTGSVSSVRGDIITAQSNANPMMALQGTTSGVRVVGSANPGDSPSVKIRGVGTTGNSNPLYVVDGMMTENVQFLNNNDIESIEVLKDASATAIYGSRGANGVILISTKKGSSNKPSFTFNGYEGVQSPQPFELVSASEYAQLINEGNIGLGEPKVYDDPASLGKGTDWFDEVTNPGAIRDYQVAFNQKTEDASYFISVGYHGNEGIVDKSGYERYTVRLNNQYKLTKNLTVGHNLSFVSSHKDNLNMDNTFGWLYRVKPTIPVYNEEGEYKDTQVGSNGNVVARINYTNNFTDKLAVVGNAFVDYKFFNDFTFRSSLGVDMYSSKNTNFDPTYNVENLGNQKNLVSSLSKSWARRKNWLWENTITYDKTLGDHHINVLAGYTAQENNFESLNGSRSNLFAEDESLWYLNAGATEGQTNGNSGTSNAITSKLFRANYSYNSRYVATATMRSDASSRFPASGREGIFPSVALAWNVSNENFMSDVSFLSDMKIRGSWGRIGNDKIGDYRYYALATTGLNDYAIFNDEIQRGSTVTGLVNTDVTWEVSESSNIGFEVGLLKDKLSLEFDYYSRVTSDMLVKVGVPATAGLSATEGNVGEVENKGIDMTLVWKETYGDFWYNVTMTGTTVKNEVLDLGTEDQIIGGWKQVTRTRVGEPIGYFFGYKTDGIFQNQAEIDAHATQANVVPGDLRFVDVDGNGVIDSNDRTKIGESIPSLMSGLNMQFGYKGFEMGIDMYGSFGSDIFNAKSLESYSSEDNFTKEYLDRWTGEGTSNTQPRITFGGQNKEISSHWIEDGSFWKIQNVKLAYNLPQNILEKVNLRKAKVYVSGNNLYYFSDYNGASPEIGGSSLAAGIDRAVYPMVRVFKAGVSLTF